MVIISSRSWITHWLSKMQHSNSLTRCWRSFSECVSTIVTGIISHNVSHYYHYVLVPLHCPVVILDAIRKLMTLHWRWILRRGSNIVSSSSAYKGWQYYLNMVMPLHSPLIGPNARPKNVDALLTVISGIGQQVSDFDFYLSSRQILPLWKDAPTHHVDCQTCKTNNRLCSIDGHCQDILTVIGSSTIVC